MTPPGQKHNRQKMNLISFSVTHSLKFTSGMVFVSINKVNRNVDTLKLKILVNMYIEVR